MNWRKKILSKLYFKQWTIGIAETSIETIIRNKVKDIRFTWLKSENKMRSFADPCAFVDEKKQEAVIFAEDFTTGKLDGKISVLTYNKEEGFSKPKTFVRNGTHLSYPSLYKVDTKNYLMAENAYSGGLHAYEYNAQTRQLMSKTTLTNLPLVDATVLKKDGKYWLFAAMLGDGVFDELNIYYSNDFLGPYKAHALNPVKKDYNGSRPAGKFIEVDGEIYRPSQNCSDFYGQSITIQKLKKLTTTEFEEEEYMHIDADTSSEFNLGIHTINAAGGYLLADGQKGHFQPFRQLARFISRNILNNKKRIGFYTWFLNFLNTEISNMESLGYYVTENCVFV